MTVRKFAVMAGLAVIAAAPAAAQTTDRPTAAMDGRWHFNLAPYMWMTGIKGDLSVANLPSVPVEAGFSDIWDNFDMGVLGHVDARRNRVGMSVDFVYTNLGAPVVRSAPVIGSLALEADVRQLITEGTAFYRVASGGRADNPAHLDVLAGARYYGTKTRLEATTGAGAEYDSRSQDMSWVDALAGLKFRAPLGSRFALLGRADIAGFGSQLTWNVEGDLGFLASRHWTIGAGWRYMDIDYEKTDAVPAKRFGLAYSGPRTWFAYSW